MSVDEAVDYCYAHKAEYLQGSGLGDREFECLISILEENTIKPEQLPEYGME